MSLKSLKLKMRYPTRLSDSQVILTVASLSETVLSTLAANTSLTNERSNYFISFYPFNPWLKDF
jgi:hypothetical protein